MKSFQVGRVFGIPLKLDLTFLLVLPLFAYIIGVQVGQWVGILNANLGANIDPGPLTGSPSVAFGLGGLAAVGLFVGVVLHELGHSLTARRYGVHITSITLWLFGGVAQLEEFPEDWKQELYIALAGPAVSLVLAGVSYAAFLAIPAAGSFPTAVGRFVFGYLALMNVVLAAFNLLPGFPMDGGRVLRAVLARDRPYARATQIAAEVGKGFAILLGLFGLFGGGGLFLVAVAFFIYIGASSEAQQTSMKAAFEGVTVGDVMTSAEDVNTVAHDASVADLIERMFRERHTGYPVTRNGQVVGVVTLEDARQVREVERDAYRVEEIMNRELHTIAPGADVMTAITTMQKAGVGRLLVMAGGPDAMGAATDATAADDAGEFVGLLTRSDVMTALDIIKTTGSLRRPTVEGEGDQPASVAEQPR